MCVQTREEKATHAGWVGGAPWCFLSSIHPNAERSGSTAAVDYLPIGSHLRQACCYNLVCIFSHGTEDAASTLFPCLQWAFRNSRLLLVLGCSDLRSVFWSFGVVGFLLSANFSSLLLLGPKTENWGAIIKYSIIASSAAAGPFSIMTHENPTGWTRE